MKQENKQAWTNYVDDMDYDRLKIYIINLIETENKIKFINNGINKSPEYIDERNFFKWLAEHGLEKLKVNNGK